MSKPSAPAAPDPTATINAQGANDKSTAIANAELNRIDQNTPYGSSTYNINGYNPDGTPQYSQTTSLAPPQQQLLNLQNQGELALGSTAVSQLGNLQNDYSQPISTAGLPGVATSAGQPSTSLTSQISNGGPGLASSIGSPTIGISGTINNSGPAITSQVNGGQSYQDAIKQAQNAAYQGQTQYLDPQFQQGQQSLDAKLANEGLSTGSTAYDNAQKNFGLQKQQAYQSAQNAAVSAGDAEQNTLYGQGLSNANLQNSANAQGFGQGQAQLTAQNSANAQQYGQNLNNATFQNTANAQGFDQGAQQATLQNSVNNSQFSQGLSNANLQNSAQAQGLQQLFALRNQPLNEYNALATGAQVTQPTFNSTPAVNQAGTNVAGITNSAYQNQLQQYQQQNAGINNLFSLGGSLGAAALLA